MNGWRPVSPAPPSDDELDDLSSGGPLQRLGGRSSRVTFAAAVRAVMSLLRLIPPRGVRVEHVIARHRQRLHLSFFELDQEEQAFVSSVLTANALTLASTEEDKKSRESVTSAQAQKDLLQRSLVQLPSVPGATGAACRETSLRLLAQATFRSKLSTARHCWIAHIQPAWHQLQDSRELYSTMKAQFKSARTDYLREITHLRDRARLREDPEARVDGTVDTISFYDPSTALDPSELNFLCKAVSEKVKMIFEAGPAGGCNLAQLEQLFQRKESNDTREIKSALKRKIEEVAALRKALDAMQADSSRRVQDENGQPRTAAWRAGGKDLGSLAAKEEAFQRELETLRLEYEGQLAECCTLRLRLEGELEAARTEAEKWEVETAGLRAQLAAMRGEAAQLRQRLARSFCAVACGQPGGRGVPGPLARPGSAPAAPRAAASRACLVLGRRKTTLPVGEVAAAAARAARSERTRAKVHWLSKTQLDMDPNSNPHPESFSLWTSESRRIFKAGTTQAQQSSHNCMAWQQLQEEGDALETTSVHDLFDMPEAGSPHEVLDSSLHDVFDAPEVRSTHEMSNMQQASSLSNRSDTREDLLPEKRFELIHEAEVRAQDVMQNHESFLKQNVDLKREAQQLREVLGSFRQYAARCAVEEGLLESQGFSHMTTLLCGDRRERTDHHFPAQDSQHPSEVELECMRARLKEEVATLQREVGQAHTLGGPADVEWLQRIDVLRLRVNRSKWDLKHAEIQVAVARCEEAARTAAACQRQENEVIEPVFCPRCHELQAARDLLCRVKDHATELCSKLKDSAVENFQLVEAYGKLQKDVSGSAEALKVSSAVLRDPGLRAILETLEEAGRRTVHDRLAAAGKWQSQRFAEHRQGYLEQSQLELMMRVKLDPRVTRPRPVFVSHDTGPPSALQPDVLIAELPPLLQQRPSSHLLGNMSRRGRGVLSRAFSVSTHATTLACVRIGGTALSAASDAAPDLQRSPDPMSGVSRSTPTRTSKEVALPLPMQLANPGLSHVATILLEVSAGTAPSRAVTSGTDKKRRPWSAGSPKSGVSNVQYAAEEHNEGGVLSVIRPNFGLLESNTESPLPISPKMRRKRSSIVPALVWNARQRAAHQHEALHTAAALLGPQGGRPQAAAAPGTANATSSGPLGPVLGQLPPEWPAPPPPAAGGGGQPRLRRRPVAEFSVVAASHTLKSCTTGG